MDELKESSGWLDSVKAALYERVSSPFIGSFLLAWSAINYKLILILFSDYDTDYKFNYIECFLYPTFNDGLYHFLLYPLFYVICFYLIVPIPSILAYAASNYTKMWLENTRHKIRNITPVSPEKARALYKQIAELDKEKAKIIQHNSLITEALRKELKDAEAKISTTVTVKEATPSKKDTPKFTGGNPYTDSNIDKNEDAKNVALGQELADLERKNPIQNFDINKIMFEISPDISDVVNGLAGMRDDLMKRKLYELIMIVLNNYESITLKSLQEFIMRTCGFDKLESELFLRGMKTANYIKDPRFDGIIKLGEKGKSELVNSKLSGVTVKEYIVKNF